ncbi:ankyrin repeat domain-containing protein [Methyloversatilis sp.]|uniref:ankyrin repeat domain-containing protein n=1 Tax=Methyloversatilis sp. TaxID=2569862 RepID=UPI0027B9D6EA|nr:ankyrin repeat domain-containing protein [Methyloversatilis sp.]
MNRTISMRRSKTAFLLLGLWLTGAQAQDVPPEWQGRIAEPERPRAAVPATALEYADIRRSGADVDPRTYRAADIALLSAARRGEWVTAAKLLKAGAPANARDVWGDSVLVHAAAAGETEFVRALINAGAHVDRRGSKGFTPLGAAALAGHHKVVDLLLRAGADIDAKSSNGHTPLIDAVMLDRSEVVAVLLRHRPQWELQTEREFGRHALSLAASLGHLNVLDQLLAAGFDPNIPDRGGFNALYWAVFKKQRLAVAHLLALGADPGAMSTDIYD